MMTCIRTLRHIFFSHECWRERAHFSWRVNTWLSWNGGWVVYAILMIAIALQQNEATEPTVAGFFWISLLSFVAGHFTPFFASDIRGLYQKVGTLLIGVALQAYLIAFQWELLCQIDHLLKTFRGTVFGNHLVLGWIVGTFFTLLTLWRCKKAGCFFHSIPERPGYVIEYPRARWWT